MHRLTSERHPGLLTAFLLFLLAGPLGMASAFGQVIDCDAQFVTLDGAQINVSATGDDDTANIQCALDEAIKFAIPRVQLASAAFSIDRLTLTDYRGSLSGVSIASTSLNVRDGSNACGAEDDDEEAKIIEVMGGNIKIERMSIVADDPCASGVRYTLIDVRQLSCNTRTVFANVDRVVLQGGYFASDNSLGVGVFSAEGCAEAGQGALGTLKVNRSTIAGVVTGVASSMLGAAQVDINFNTITDVANGIAILDANQSTTITGNLIEFNEQDSAANNGVAFGVVAATTESYAPGANRTVIHSNRFVDMGANASGFAIAVSNIDVRAEHSLVITSNTFTGEGATSGAIFTNDVDTGVVQGNQFIGVFNCGLLADTDAFEQDAVGWGVFANSFAQASSVTGDICLGAGTSGWIVDASGGTGIDLGNNTVIGM